MRYILVNEDNGIVENAIELDEGHDWPVPEGFRLEQNDFADIGHVVEEQKG